MTHILTDTTEVRGINFFSNTIDTIKDAFDIGKHLQRIIEKALDPVENLIDHTSETMKGLLEEVHSSITDILDTISETYQDNLNITIDSLDNFTRNKILEVLDAFEEISDLFQENVKVVGETAENIIRSVSINIKQTGAELEKNLTNVLIVAGETGSFLVDKAIYNIITLAAWALLGIGLIVMFAVLGKRGLPDGFAGVLMTVIGLAFMGGFGVLAFIPKFRTKIMEYTGLGLKERLEFAKPKPRIFGANPETIRIGTTKEVTFTGINLLLDGKPPKEAFIHNRNVTIKASSDESMVLDTSTLSLSSGSVNVTLVYDQETQLRHVIKIYKKVPKKYPDLYISHFSINPSTPEAKRSAIATIRVKNRGEGDTTRNVTLKWKPYDRHTGISRTVAPLKSGQSKEFKIDYTYPSAGNFSSVVTVDANDRVDESSESNNIKTKNIRVKAFKPDYVPIFKRRGTIRLGPKRNDPLEVDGKFGGDYFLTGIGLRVDKHNNFTTMVLAGRPMYQNGSWGPRKIARFGRIPNHSPLETWNEVPAGYAIVGFGGRISNANITTQVIYYRKMGSNRRLIGPVRTMRSGSSPNHSLEIAGENIKLDGNKALTGIGVNCYKHNLVALHMHYGELT